MKYLFYILTFAAFAASCTNSTKSAPVVIPRDTTIQPNNSFTSLFLDSMAVAAFVNKEALDDSLKPKVTGFYNARNYQFAWFTENGLSEAGEAFWNLHQDRKSADADSTAANEPLHTVMQNLLNGEEVNLSNDSIQKIELNLTAHFFKYVKTAFGGNVDPSDMQWYIPKRKLDATALLDSFLTGNGKTVRPFSKAFYQLQSNVARYADVVKNGGWAPVEMKGKRLKKGDRNKAVVALKKRLAATGDFAGQDTSNLYTAELADAVIKAERRFGLKEDGIVTGELVGQLNVPAKDRMQQMLINLERLRWLPDPPPNRLVANIPEYRLHVYEDGKDVLAMNIVVGKAANRTVIFSDELQYVVFSPYWNIPRSIVRNEIVPAMNRSSSYLSRNNMEITGYSNGLPVVRQKPGGQNALGRVKFIFPNRYNIYFHDTPAKTLFSQESRAFSHGCVRLQKPATLAEYLLRNQDGWTEEKVDEAMHSEKEKWVKLPKKVPVYLVYLTAWVDEDGVLNFRDDIYGHDKRMAEGLFTGTDTAK